MTVNKLIDELETEWDLDNGFFGVLRSGIFSNEKYQRLLGLLRAVEIDGEFINRRLVSLLWYIPLFMSWQKERVLEADGDVQELESAINAISSILESKLGVP